MSRITAEQIDAVLPQTQCGLCTYPGCLPYAKALAEQQADINLCPPGGVPGLLKLANLLQRDPTPFIEDMSAKAKSRTVAVIREAECIGCTKCIQACPVDAILGSGKHMHTVISSECTGCDLCIAPCPVDCIDTLVITEELDEIAKTKQANHFRQRYQAREQRLRATVETPEKDISLTLQDKQSYIAAALLRVKK